MIDTGFLTIFRTVLSSLAALSLLVAVFSIYNTQSILAAQRTRESALLRAIGASRRQVLLGAIGEATIVGPAASVLGPGGGLLLTTAVTDIFVAASVTLPGTGLVLQPVGMVIAFAIGVATTVLASLVPASRASRVAPIAALRAVDASTSNLSRARSVIGAALLAIGATGVVAGLAGTGLVVGTVGSALTVAAAIMLGPLAAGSVLRLFALPLTRRPGSAGMLAVRNGARDPHRVASAATALMVGTLLVSLATVVAGSLRASLDDNAGGAGRADLVVSPTSAGGAAASLSPDVVTVVKRVRGVAQIAVLGGGTALVHGTGKLVTVVHPQQVDGLVDFGFRSGTLSDLTGDTAAVRDDSGWHTGDTVPITFPDGTSVPTRVAAVFTSRGLLGDVVLPASTWAAHSTQPAASNVLIRLAAGSDSAQVVGSLGTALKPYGGPPLRDRQAFIDVQTANVASALNMVYVMLALAVLIAVLGIANTVSLSVFERTRELGLLRAAGLTRRQTRATVRIEAVLVAAFGSLGGVLLGGLAGAVVVLSANSPDLSVLALPPVPLVVILVGGALSGVLAAIRPARRAARLDVLAAIGAT